MIRIITTKRLRELLKRIKNLEVTVEVLRGKLSRREEKE